MTRSRSTTGSNGEPADFLSSQEVARPVLSVVTTLYRSAAYVEEFHRRMSAAAAAFAGDYEILFVDDGSPDESLAVALKVMEKDPHVRVIELSRNFGHHRAIMTGLHRATGDLVFLIDVDL